jgi:hypothetical protein
MWRPSLHSSPWTLFNPPLPPLLRNYYFYKITPRISSQLIRPLQEVQSYQKSKFRSYYNPLFSLKLTFILYRPLNTWCRDHTPHTTISSISRHQHKNSYNPEVEKLDNSQNTTSYLWYRYIFYYIIKMLFKKKNWPLWTLLKKNFWTLI